MKRLLLILFLLPAFVKGQNITTFAGGGTILGDGGPATAANLSVFPGITFDTSGNLIIAANNEQRVRKIDVITGIITTIAGTGVSGYNGDGIPATTAQLYYPNNIAVDHFNNLYISDHTNRIRKVSATTGIITTIAGNGTAGFSGDGGPAISAKINGPEVIVFDFLGNLYFGDQSNYRVRKIDTDGIITTVAGNGIYGYGGDGGPSDSASFRETWGICLDMDGNLFIADLRNYRVRKVNMSTGIVTTVVGNGLSGFSGDNGPDTAARVEPWYIAFDAHKNLYISDSERIRMVDTNGIIHTIAGTGVWGFGGDNGPAIAAQFSQNAGLAFDSCGYLYIADAQNQRVRKITFDSCGTTSTLKSNSVNNIPVFNLYPNPTITELTISAPDIITTIAISNLLGQRVFSQQYNSPQVQVDVADLPAGIYLIRINGTEVRKFVKQ